MKLRFRINQAEAFRRGIDAPKSIVSIEVNPADLPIETRMLIAKHMHGIDVCELMFDGASQKVKINHYTSGSPVLVEADTPTLDGLIEAVRKNEEEQELATKCAEAEMTDGELERMHRS